MTRITADFVIQKLAAEPFMKKLERSVDEYEAKRAQQKYDAALSRARGITDGIGSSPSLAGGIAGADVVSQRKTSRPVVKALSPSYQIGIRALSVGGNAGPSAGPSAPSVRRTKEERFYGPGADRVDPPTEQQAKNLDAFQKGMISRSEFVRRRMLGM
jgi:hypothetical protein